MTNDTDYLGFTHRFECGVGDAPVLLLLHGTAGSEDDLLPMGRRILPGASLLSPRGKVLERGKPRFFRRVEMTVFDEEDLVFRTHELADFVAAAAAHYQLPVGKIVALGYSNGAHMAASLMLLRPEVLCSAILLRARVPLHVRPLPDLRGKLVLLSEAHNDIYIPDHKALELESDLRAAGAEVETLWTAPAHSVEQPEIDVVGRWAQLRIAR